MGMVSSSPLPEDELASPAPANWLATLHQSLNSTTEEEASGNDFDEGGSGEDPYSGSGSKIDSPYYFDDGGYAAPADYFPPADYSGGGSGSGCGPCECDIPCDRSIDNDSGSGNHDVNFNFHGSEPPSPNVDSLSTGDWTLEIGSLSIGSLSIGTLNVNIGSLGSEH